MTILFIFYSIQIDMYRHWWLWWWPMVTLVIGDGAGDNTGGGDHFLD